MTKISEWQGGGGRWYAADISDLKNGSSEWWKIPRKLGMPLTDYVKMLVYTYKVDNIYYNKEKNFLYFAWEKYVNCHNYMLDMNRKLKSLGK